jgi:hypothetical protein
MTRHHDRVRAVLLVQGLEAERRSGSGDGGEADGIGDLIARVTRIQAQYARLGPEADGWLLAVYDAALAQLCGALGVRHSLLDEAVCSDRERQRVELALLPSVLPLAR